MLTMLRIFTVAIIGIILYWSLLFIAGLKKGGRLKRRKKGFVKAEEEDKTKIVAACIFILFAGIILIFLIIKFGVRGVACEYKIE